MALKRIRKQLKDYYQSSPTQYGIIQIQDDPYHLNAIILGPENSPYANGIFYLEIHLPTSYPFKPPKCNFITKIYHPNISNNGLISLSILQQGWSPAYTIQKTIKQILYLLTDPNPDDPFIAEIALIYKQNRSQYNENVKKWVLKYAQ